MLSGTVLPLERGDFPDPKPCTAIYKCGWSAVTAGELNATIKRSSGGVLEMVANGGTVPPIKALWNMSFDFRSLVDEKNLRPVQCRIKETYGEEILFSYLRFGKGDVQRLRQAIPPDKNPPRWKHFVYPGVTDLFGGLLLIRSQKLRAGDVYTMVVYPQTAPYIATFKVMGSETVSIHETQRNAIRLDLKLQKLSKKGQSEPYKSFKSASVWISDDANRMVLKAKAEIFVGSIWVELAKL